MKQSTLSEILNAEMQRLCIQNCDRIRLLSLINEAQSVLSKYEKEKTSQSVSYKQQLWERKLLDLSFHNNLLNMKEGKKVVRFTPCPIDELEDCLADGQEFPVSAELVDLKILQSLYRTARTLLEESGTNSLYLSIGVLKYEGHMAPLLLVPIEISIVKKGQYVIRSREEQTMFNFTLVEFLKQNYGVELSPYTTKDGELPADAHGLDVSLIMHLVRNAISEQAGWEVDEISHLGIFSFTKYIMWNDIHTHSQVLSSHPVLHSLVEGRLMLQDKVSPADVRELDVCARPEDFALPMPCDSSQMEAAIDAAAGRSFILYGPPGTGKSQTITNMIANAMYHGKRVLFVAQKKAALDVVESRLNSVGLSAFCLELHSSKMHKQLFLSHLDSLIQLCCDVNIQKGDKLYSSKSNELYAKRVELADYLKALRYKSKEEDLSLQDCIDLYSSIDSQYEIIPKVQESGMMTFMQKKDVHLFTKDEMDEIARQCFLLDAGESILGMSSKDFPLAGLHPKSDQRDLEKSLLQDLSQLVASVERAQTQADSEMNRKFMKKSARELLENDYRWRHFAQIAQPDASLLDDLDALKSVVVRWIEGIELLPKWMKYLEPEEVLRKKGLSEAIDFHSNGHSGKETAEAIRKGWLRQMAERRIKDNPVLASFNGILFEQVIQQYRQMAIEFQKLTMHELANILLQRLQDHVKDADISAEMTLLRKRIANKGRGTSIRGIIDQMPHLLPYMSPCMLMSPLSVAQYLDMDGDPFDIVIFDEASQMPTGEAVGAIARGKSVVIVGDPKQMPPTSFFATSATDEEEADNDDLESILDDCISLSMPTRYLGWHYRSKHESLISFSNKNYYDNRLFTFPSADNMVSHVSWVKVDGFYDYGKTRTNRAEADAVVADILDRLRKDDGRSIGVVAFSKQQSDLIEDVLTEALYANPDLETRSRELAEPLFVKNLENVQGDERDVILFSVGYGPDKSGNVSMNFGPLNKAGGEKRLNVAVSRARYEMRVFSTLQPEQIDERRTNAEGVLHLKKFLLFAQQGYIALEGGESGPKTSGSLIHQIADKLRDHGYSVDENVGASNIKIDIAIINPRDKNTYLLGIICDGENYRKHKTIKDREIVFPSVLQMVGWNLMHVWSVDWFVNPEMVIMQIEDQLRKIV